MRSLFMNRRPCGRRAVLAQSFLGALVLVLAPAVARAQEVILPELPFTAKHGVNARAAGLGYAYGAVAEDGSALWFNPAGLGQIRKMELSGGLLHEAQERTATFDTATDGFAGTGRASESTEISKTSPTQLTFAYPFPTYRGSVVMAFGYQRLVPLSSDYYRQGDLEAQEGAAPGLREIESYYEDGSVDFWTFGLGGDLSRSVSVGGTFSYIDGQTTQGFEVGRLRTLSNGTTDVNGSDDVFLSSEVRDADLSGWAFALGVLGRPSDNLRLGFTLNGPEKYEFDGVTTTRFEDQEKIDGQDFGFHDEITLPFSLLGSVAFTPSNFLITGDARWTDWTQIDFEGPIRSEDRQFAYQTTVDFSLGAEYQFSSVPMRIRGGVSFQPMPYELIPTDIAFTFVPDDGDDETTDDASYFTRDYEEAHFETGRMFYSLGAGTLIEDALALDVAWVHGEFERSNPSGTWTEDWSTDRIYATATFRF